MSIPFTWGARRIVVRAISRGEFTPSWAIVGGGFGEMVKSGVEISQADCEAVFDDGCKVPWTMWLTTISC